MESAHSSRLGLQFSGLQLLARAGCLPQCCRWGASQSERDLLHLYGFLYSQSHRASIKEEFWMVQGVDVWENSGHWGALDSRISAPGGPRAEGSTRVGLIVPRKRCLRLPKVESERVALL